MKSWIVVTLLSVTCWASAQSTSHTLKNKFLARTLSWQSGHLKTTSVENLVAKTQIKPTDCPEFSLRFSKGTDKEGTDFTLTSADFSVVNVVQSTPERFSILLRNEKNGIAVTVHYELNPNEFYMRKQLSITSKQALALERVDVDVLCFADATQPYTTKVINAQGAWKPGLGQPLYGSKSATFWGVEFPAAYNTVTDSKLSCGYLWGKTLTPAKPYLSYKAVLGVGDDPRFISDAFYAYIKAIRIRPLRLQVQYNSWFDYGDKISKETFTASVKKINSELVTKRGCKPLNAYVIDDGWQYRGFDPKNGHGLWSPNKKFDSDFATSVKSVKDSGSDLGFWLSPGCFFGSQPIGKALMKVGYEGVGSTMSMCGPKYMDLLEKRILELEKQGVVYFKFDGLFGHLNMRNFELKSGRGCPSMPQLGLDGLEPNDKKLNDHKYDEMKTYYLVAGTERLMTLCKNMTKANPKVFIAITNGAYLSPWWLQYADIVWLINAGDAAGGADRTAELVYRDGVYHQIWTKEKTQFPMSAIFNHEPKKKKTGEPEEVFRHYLFMNLSRGTGFIELYIKPRVLSESDWNVLAEGLKWAREAFPTFERVRMHGGDPRKKEVYGYTAWNENQGYISMHNPSDEEKTYSVKLDRAAGLVASSGPFVVTSPLKNSLKGVQDSYKDGDTLTVTLQPKEIRLVEFHAKK